MPSSLTSHRRDTASRCVRVKPAGEKECSRLRPRRNHPAAPRREPGRCPRIHPPAPPRRGPCPPPRRCCWAHLRSQHLEGWRFVRRTPSSSSPDGPATTFVCPDARDQHRGRRLLLSSATAIPRRRPLTFTSFEVLATTEAVLSADPGRAADRPRAPAHELTPLLERPLSREARRLPAPSGSAVLCRRVDWVPCAGHSTPRAQVGRRPVAVHVEREDGTRLKPPAASSSRSPRTALFPDGRQTPDDHHCASAGRRLATTGSDRGSRVPIHSAIGRFAASGKTEEAGGLSRCSTSRST